MTLPKVSTVNVDPGLLAAAAAHADTESRAVLAAHGAVDAALEAARFGWVGSSEAALTDTAERWSAATAELGRRLYRHAEALRVSALSFAAMEDEHGRALAALRPPDPA